LSYWVIAGEHIHKVRSIFISQKIFVCAHVHVRMCICVFGISFGARSPFIGGGIGGGGGDDEKGTMQNLNDRLATYLEDVWSLENGNAELELRIREFLENKTSPGSRDYSAFFTSASLCLLSVLLNTSIYLANDNAKLAADDFKTKRENELSMRQSVEADFAGLKRVLDVLAPVISVEMDLGPTQDLNAVLSEIRKQYEQASAKNKKELNAWFQEKEVAVSTETNLNRLLQSLQREHQSQLTMKGSLEGTLQETENQVTSLEEQLVNLQGDIDRQGQEYQMLLDTKTCLEMEIAEYRRLDSPLLHTQESKTQSCCVVPAVFGSNKNNKECSTLLTKTWP
uniref:IF rod domain-containing protein n=1 Tax=Gadus morhua TaxID=8049 RepID=A0A8C5CUX9_GADMO